MRYCRGGYKKEIKRQGVEFFITLTEFVVLLVEGKRGLSPIWRRWVCAAEQGMVFRVLSHMQFHYYSYRSQTKCAKIAIHCPSPR